MTGIDIHRIAFDKVAQLSKSDVAYASQPEKFARWISHMPNLSAFGAALEAKRKQQFDRDTLVEVLTEQYKHLDVTNSHLKDLSASNQFFVTTAHQPSLFTGPLYFIYKICSAINLARTLEVQYNDNQIHPLLIIGGEDHDFDEINHLNLFGRSFSWETHQQGACGKMSLDGIDTVREEIKQVLGSSPFADELRAMLDASFGDSTRNYGQAMQHFVLTLFEGTRLIVLQMDDPRLKKQFATVMEDELLNQTSQGFIEESQKGLESEGFKPQAYIREINLFYFSENGRHRIALDGEGKYRVVDTEISFTREEMQAEVAARPERFSPNVNLRPLYQETVLPNLAYIGGGGELAYWLERKAQFGHYNVPFPILIRRNSVLYIDKGNRKLREKLGIEIPELFDHPDLVVKNWIKTNSTKEVELRDQMQSIDSAIDQMIAKAKPVDPTVAQKIEAFKAKVHKEIDGLEKRLIRAEKSQHDVTVQKIEKLLNKLFPGGSLQERHDNFMSIYLQQGRPYLDRMIEVLDPLRRGFIILEENPDTQ